MRAQASIAVKICGITTAKQALEISALGADAIGIIGVKSSPRFLSDTKRRAIFQSLKNNAPKVERVWVVANIDSNELEEGINGIGLPSIIQLHGQESKKQCEAWRKSYPQVQWWKSFQIRQPNDLHKAKDYQDSVDAILLDAWSNKTLGGTGKRIPYELLDKVNFRIPWWLAGGISPDWIQKILLDVKPFGIDASSKLETKPGVKDIQKVKDLLQKVKASKQIT